MDKSKQVGKQTLVEEGTELKGTLRSSCQVVVNGTIDGQIEAPALTITSTGTVLGSVKAEKLRSEGTLAGDIDAEDVYLAGTVRSNTMIRAKRLEVKLAPERGRLEVTFGECLMEVGEDPAHVEEPVPDVLQVAPAAPALVEQPPSMAEEAPAPPPPGEDEPTWSEPPAGRVSGSDEASNEDETRGVAAPVGGSDEAPAPEARERETAENNGSPRRRRNAERRDSQAPPG